LDYMKINVKKVDDNQSDKGSSRSMSHKLNESNNSIKLKPE